MPKFITYSLKQSEVDNMRLLAPNKVLIEIVERNVDRKTASGLILVSPTYRTIERTSANPTDPVDWVRSQNADRTGLVRGVPNQLVRKRNHLWKTTVETEVGDTVWFDFMTGENCDRIQTESKLYYLMDYFDLYAVRRGDEVIMLNGYCLFSPVKDDVKSSLAIDTGRMDARFGVAEYLGSYNEYYFAGLADDPMIQKGHKCVFSLPPVMLESEYMARFDGKKQYRISQRHNIMAYIDVDIHATLNHVVIVPEYDTHKGGIEIPEPYRKPNGYGTVHSSRYIKTGMKCGDRIQYLPQAGLMVEHEGGKYHVVHERDVLVTFNNE